MSQAMENRKGRMLIGTVVSDKNDKTIVVRVETLVKHPLLKKIVEFRPMSRNKRWHLVTILEKAV